MPYKTISHKITKNEHCNFKTFSYTHYNTKNDIYFKKKFMVILEDQKLQTAYGRDNQK